MEKTVNKDLIKNNILLSFLAALVMVLCLSDTASACASALKTLTLWARSIVPPLLPFSIAAYTLLYSGFIFKLSPYFDKAAEKLFGLPGVFIPVYFISVICGCPVGAKFISECAKKGHLNAADAESILPFTCVPGVMFTCGTVCTGLLKLNSRDIFAVIAAVYSAPLILALFLKRKHFKTNAFSGYRANDDNILSSAITSAVSSMVTIGGTMVIFGIICDYVSQNLGNGIFGASVCGILEMTSGCSLACSFPNDAAALLCVFFISFGGISVYLQTVNASYPLNTKGLLLYKGLQALLSSVIYVFLSGKPGLMQVYYIIPVIPLIILLLLKDRLSAVLQQ